jgi:glutamate synthase (NADPH/NADH) small chain
MDYGQEEAAALQGSDPRYWAVDTKKFVGDSEGRVRELHTVVLDWRKGPDGRLHPVEIPGSGRVFPAELVLLALGFLGPEKKGLVSDLKLKLDERGNVGDGEMAAPGICHRRHGPQPVLVVWAIEEGHKASRGVDSTSCAGDDLP